MWFKQIQLFQLADSFPGSSAGLSDKLAKFEFHACLPSIPFSAGWVSPVEEDQAPLVQTLNGYRMICLQVEEKILPAFVIQQELAKKIKQIEVLENRKVGQKEKYALKDEITAMLLPRAFSKLTKVYAYIDSKNQWLVIGTANTKKIEQFLAACNKALGEVVHSFSIKKISAILTSWLKQQNYSSSFSIEKSCVLQDMNHQNRVIRCKEQDLFAASIQALIKDGCAITQLSLNWQDCIDFVLLDDLSLQSIRFKDDVTGQAKDLEPGSKQQQFNADFFIMTGTLEGLLKDLVVLFTDQPLPVDKNKTTANNTLVLEKSA